MENENEDQVNPELENDENDVDVYGAEENEDGNVDSFDLGDEDETDFDKLDDLDISDDEGAVDGKSVSDEDNEDVDAGELLASMEMVMDQLRALITGEDDEESDLGEIDDGDEDFAGEDEAELGVEGEEGLEESLTNPKPMNKDGIVDTKIVSGGNESAKMKTNGPKAKKLPNGKKPKGDEAVDDPHENNKTSANAGKGTKKTNLPAAKSVLDVVNKMLSGNGKIISDLYSGKTIAKEAFEAVEYKIDKRTISAISKLDENLSDDFKTGMIPVFERAVSNKIRSIMSAAVPHLNNMVSEEIVKIEATMIDSIDSYLDNVVESYFDENKKVIEEAASARVSNTFLEGLKALYEAEAVEVPQGKENLVEKLERRLSVLENKNSILAEETRKYKSNYAKARKENILTSVTEGLSLRDAERVKELAGKQSCKTLREFKETAISLKKSIVETKSNTPTRPIETLVETFAPKSETKMDIYARALTKGR